MSDLPAATRVDPEANGRANGDATQRGAASDAKLAGLTFAAVSAALLGAIVLSAIVFADLSVIRPEGLARFCIFLALMTGYVAAAAVVSQRGAARDFAALRAVTEATSTQWDRHERRFLDRRGARIAAAAGALAGVGIERIGAYLGGATRFEAWSGLLVWTAILNALLFAGLAVLARWTVLEIRSLRAIGQRVRVSLLDRTALAPFARTGVRSALLWLVGSSLATSLMLDVNAPWLVALIVVFTIALGVGALLLPSLGVHRRLAAAKEAELAWVRGEIARAREALGGAHAAARDEAARLPALLAWEARIADVSAWPFGAPGVLRVALLLLLPLGSWTGGALVDHALDAVLGR